MDLFQSTEFISPNPPMNSLFPPGTKQQNKSRLIRMGKSAVAGCRVPIVKEIGKDLMMYTLFNTVEQQTLRGPNVIA